MRARNLDAADHGFVVQAPVQQRRRHDADIHDIDATVGQTAYQFVSQQVATGAIVPPDGDGSANILGAKIRRIAPSERIRDLGRQVRADDAANVVLAKNGLADMRRWEWGELALHAGGAERGGSYRRLQRRGARLGIRHDCQPREPGDRRGKDAEQQQQQRAGAHQSRGSARARMGPRAIPVGVA